MKSLRISLGVASACVLVGCSQPPQNETVAQVSPPTQTTPNVEPAQGSQDKQLAMDDFLAAISAKKMLASNGKPMTVENKGEGCGFLSAKDCALLQLHSGSVQVAEFDTSISSGREALKKLKRDGFMGQPYLFSKNLAIAKNQKVAQWDEVKSVFESL